MIKALSETSLLFWRDNVDASRIQLLSLIASNFPLYSLALYALNRSPDVSTLTAALISSVFFALGGYLLVVLCIFLPTHAINEQLGLRLARSLMLFWLTSLIFFAHNAFDPISLLNGHGADLLSEFLPFPPEQTYWILALAYSLLAALILGIWTERKEAQPPRSATKPFFLYRMATVLFFVLINTILLKILVFESSTVTLAKALWHPSK
jgi:hypothetical protein